MKIEFADSFGKSLKRLIRHQTWWYKTYHFLRYDIKHFVKNVWYFRKGLWNYRWWDYRFPLEMFKLSIEGMYPKVEKYGLEIDETRLKKVNKMIRACELMQNFMDENFVDQAEKELGDLKLRKWEFEDVPDKPGYSQLVDSETDEEKSHNRKVFDRAREIEEEQWNELWNIMRGRNDGKSNSIAQVALSDSDNQSFETKFDGTDLRSWWD